MGNSNTRPKICQVAAFHDQAMEDERSLLPASKWMITTVQGTEMQEKEILGQRESNHLPPLPGRQEVPLNVGLETAVEGNEMEDRQRVRLVSRPTERNIFWDESEGQILDVRDLLQPSPELIDPDSENGMKIKPQTDRGFESEVEEWKFEGPVVKSCRKSLCKTHLERGLTESVQRSCDLPWLQDWRECKEKHHATKNVQMDSKERAYGRYSVLCTKRSPEEWKIQK
ncbi:hypothetical protein E1301_Tti006278 [Triplophysa tibetana]|uniref:Uncharacterized protein n=1 Tax=Triplophysa tibetana TaxID=1572043 RepID=A0A5A9NR14_9TELE|nr:hypothetical protein E1301_Tti006278 [Triplophysa tibetana]